MALRGTGARGDPRAADPPRPILLAIEAEADTIAGALAAVEGIAAVRAQPAGVTSVQEYHQGIG